ncbi:potassium transporter TrkG [uncultured Vibrio sp.]|uniref:TrkH family potassium uptake protein n=1 Tax=uncultured Vibrio sp. TaxID=114054 RepID=UPI002AA661BD|nr:potassium transporter TrkG [uncultured Vibrio sp.]
MTPDHRRNSGQTTTFKGAWYVLVPAPLILPYQVTTASNQSLWSLVAAMGASLGLLGLALLCERTPTLAKVFGFLALFGCGLAGGQYFSADPLFALLGGVALIQAGFFLLDHPSSNDRTKINRQRRYFFHTARNSLYALVGLASVSFLFNPAHLQIGEYAVALATLICQIPVALWLHIASQTRRRFLWLVLPLVIAGLTIAAIFIQFTAFAALSSALFTLWVLPYDHSGLIEHRERWWEPFLNHPARALISTFFSLCFLGTLLLQLPWAATGNPLPLIDAAFTSVSAVCVTGLSVVDTQADFTLFGQSCILLLIQLGGLGIMTITTVALHALGKRLSLRQERLLTTLNETSHQELLFSLVGIVRFTLIVEGIGALLLTMGYMLDGMHWMPALWKGIFTAVSAFCNAGFALDSTSLIPYQHQPFILHSIALLIILGGLAPSTCLVASQWIRGRRIDIAPRIALVTTCVLLIGGTCSFLVFEWDHVLDGLDFSDKLHNAWFQSVTLRTAGFNSVDLAPVLSPTLLIMLFCMFIGGSPGGTAGGIKTTTLGILALTFWSTITGRKSVIAQNRKIPQALINRTITVFFAGIIVWLVVVLALALTQEMPARELVFEATSALGTVGLSLGITPKLDVIGKIIIMLTMFIGRIGPMTLFTLLSAEHQGSHSRYPDARITLS